jgi:dihydroorotate dehydrogenase
MYKLFRPLLFSIDPERIHGLVFGILKAPMRWSTFRSVLHSLYDVEDRRLERTLFGLTFKNPVGLAAGFDKDAKLIDALSCFGFGFIEIGTLTPQPQPGNEKPRLFRLPKDGALINRMGFNNEGAEAAAARLKRRRSKTIVGGNIGKNKSTPNDSAAADYTTCFNALYEHVDYFVVNVSSPNTPGLRELQEKAPLQQLLSTVKGLSLEKPIHKPVLLKIAPDLTQGQLDDIVDILKATHMDGVIATNTTISRDGLETDPDELGRIGAGGLSGKPLARRSTEVIRYLRERLGKAYPIIGVGGIMSPADAVEKLNAGADLIQIYTGFVYEGPALVEKINRKLLKKVRGAAELAPG